MSSERFLSDLAAPLSVYAREEKTVFVKFWMHIHCCFRILKDVLSTSKSRGFMGQEWSDHAINYRLRVESQVPKEYCFFYCVDPAKTILSRKLRVHFFSWRYARLPTLKSVRFSSLAWHCFIGSSKLMLFVPLIGDSFYSFQMLPTQ